jgi:hypothetical protein
MLIKYLKNKDIITININNQDINSYKDIAIDLTPYVIGIPNT